MTTFIDRLTAGYFSMVGARSRWVDASAGRIHVLDLDGTGDLPTLVLVHGMSARSTHFAGVAHRLRAHYRRILIPDLLGHGRSFVPDEPISGPTMQQAFNETLDALLDGVEPVVLYGNSLGGYGAIRYAHRSPERVAALIVNSPGGGALRSLSMQDYLRRFDVSTHQQAVDFARDYLGGPLRRMPLRHLVARGVLAQLQDPTVRGFINSLDDSDFLEQRHLQELSMPTLMLWGQKDDIMHEEQRRFFVDNLPEDALFEQPESYGHAPYIEYPVHLADRILAFCDRQLKARGIDLNASETR
ncbi:MAG: alpha/beta hydrolase [Myxococcota bacterium]